MIYTFHFRTQFSNFQFCPCSQKCKLSITLVWEGAGRKIGKKDMQKEGLGIVDISEVDIADTVGEQSKSSCLHLRLKEQGSPSRAIMGIIIPLGRCASRTPRDF